MAKIFISYRRGDTPGTAGRLFDGLAREFGTENVFLDVDAIPLGMDFRNILIEAVGKSEVMLVLIGPRWLAASDSDGKRRLDDPHDFVRMEIEQALQLSVPVIPVLMDSASMPSPHEVPDILRPLLYRHAAAIAQVSFQSDLHNLVRAVRTLRSELGETKPSISSWKIKLLSALASAMGVGSALKSTPIGDLDEAGVEAKPIHLTRVPAPKTDQDDEVFMSYARDDMPIMQNVRRHLAKNEISVWTDDKLEPGTASWKRAVQEAIENSTCFIVLLTPSAKNSEVVQMELGYAIAHERIVLPVLAQGTNRTAVPLEIINRQWTDITETKFEDGMARLVDAVIAYRAGRSPPRIVNQRR